jgi:hypothetical protein
VAAARQQAVVGWPVRGRQVMSEREAGWRCRQAGGGGARANTFPSIRAAGRRGNDAGRIVDGRCRIGGGRACCRHRKSTLGDAGGRGGRRTSSKAPPPPPPRSPPRPPSLTKVRDLAREVAVVARRQRRQRRPLCPRRPLGGPGRRAAPRGQEHVPRAQVPMHHALHGAHGGVCVCGGGGCTSAGNQRMPCACLYRQVPGSLPPHRCVCTSVVAGSKQRGATRQQTVCACSGVLPPLDWLPPLTHVLWRLRFNYITVNPHRNHVLRRIISRTHNIFNYILIDCGWSHTPEGLLPCTHAPLRASSPARMHP